MECLGCREGTAREKAKVIGELRHEHKSSLLLDVADLPRSTYYYYTQYQHKQYQRMLEVKGIQQSMSRKGNCLDNAVIENFFGLLKTELLYLQDFDSMEHFKAELIDYLDYYNNRRIKRKGLTPAQHRYQTLQVA